MNIWSHLISTVKFLTELIGFLRLNPIFARFDTNASIRVADAAVISLYYLSVVTCFGLSTIFHVLSDHSASLHLFTNQLDHLGIVFVMWSTGISCAHFALLCASTTTRILHTSILTLVTVWCCLRTVEPRFRQSDFRRQRFSIYAILGVSLYTPLIHAWCSLGSLDKLEEAAGLRSFVQLTIINSVGGILYATKIPERLFPGAFDFVGNSHNCMHIMAIGGAIIRLRGLLSVYRRWGVADEVITFCQSPN